MKTKQTIQPLKQGQSVVCQWGGWGEAKNGVVVGLIPKNETASVLFPECKGQLRGLYDCSSKDRYLVKLDSGKYSLPYARALEKRNADINVFAEECGRA